MLVLKLEGGIIFMVLEFRCLRVAQNTWSRHEADYVCGISRVHEDSEYDVQAVKLQSEAEFISVELQLE